MKTQQALKENHMRDLIIRSFEEADAEATAKVFFDAVHQGSKDHYDDAQRQAWAPHVPDTSLWLKRLQAQSVVVAQVQGKIVGFMSLEQKDTEGHIDLAFVLPEVMGQGVAPALYERIEEIAQNLHLDKLTSHASHLARPFFERIRWQVVKEQSVARGPVELTNFVMKKELK